MMVVRAAARALRFRVQDAVLLSEISELPNTAWRATRIEGMYTLSLMQRINAVSTISDYMNECAYVRRILHGLRSPIARVVLTRLNPGYRSPAHRLPESCHYRYRIRIPVLTNTTSDFVIRADKSMSSTYRMDAGSAWVIEPDALYSYQNNGALPVVHLIIDTLGSDYFRQSLLHGKSELFFPYYGESTFEVE